jgi:hypothetical protein
VPTLNVLDNLRLPLELRGVSAATEKAMPASTGWPFQVLSRSMTRSRFMPRSVLPVWCALAVAR